MAVCSSTQVQICVLEKFHVTSGDKLSSFRRYTRRTTDVAVTLFVDVRKATHITEQKVQVPTYSPPIKKRPVSVIFCVNVT